MSQKAVEQLIGRLITDACFRERAVHALDSVCMEEGYSLTEAELRIVEGMDFNRLATTGERWLDDRIRRYTSQA